MTDISKLPYRMGVGIMLINAENKVFVGRRADSPRSSNAWQMPQGGIDEGEDVIQAALRELEEEVGTSDIAIIAQLEDWISYDLPPEWIPTLWNGKYRGQKQMWFLARLNGGDDLINIDTAHPEFIAWRWEEIDNLADQIVDFKKDMYKELVSYFKQFLK